MMFNNQPKKEKTLKEVVGDSGIVINYSKMSKEIERCRLDKQNKECRIALKEIGVEFVDE